MNTPDALEDLGLPPIDQVGFVVRSIDEAKRRYGALFGPWTEMDGSVESATYRGREADAQLRILFGHSGDLEMEFIEWQGGESPHSEFIQAGREGLHHLRYRVDDTDAWIEKMGSVGYQPIWYKKLTDDIVFAYLEREGDPLLIEFLQMVEFNKKTGMLTIQTSGLTGYLGFIDGRLKAAITSDGERADEAVNRLMGATSGQFEFSPQLPDGFAPEMDKGVSSLLMDVLRRRDESDAADSGLR